MLNYLSQIFPVMGGRNAIVFYVCFSHYTIISHESFHSQMNGLSLSPPKTGGILRTLFVQAGLDQP